MNNQFETWLGDVGVPVLFILLGSVAAYYLGSKFLNYLTRRIVRGQLRGSPRKDSEKRQATLAGLVVSIWRILVVATCLLAAFKLLFPAIDLSPLFAGAGIIGIAVAFGSQTLVKDLLTGIFIVAENQYRVGDYVKINDADGRVEQIGTRSTIIRDSSGNVHYLPNGSIIHVINKTMGYSKVNFTLLLDPSADLDAAISVVNQVGDKLTASKEWKHKILSPPQFDSVGALSGKSIEINIVGKTQPSDQWAVTAEMRRLLLAAFEENDIKLA